LLTRGFHLGLPPREDIAGNGEEPVPTLAPSDGGAANGSQAEGDDGGTSIGVIIGLVVGIVAAAAVIGLATVVLARRMR
jgi:hypothetical protein